MGGAWVGWREMMGVGEIKLVGVGEGEGVGRGEVRGGWERRSRGWDDEGRERSFYVLICFSLVK